MEEKFENEEVEFFDDIEEVEEEPKKGFVDNLKEIGKKGVNWTKGKIENIKENPEQTIETVANVGAAIGTITLIALGIADSNKRKRTVYSKDIGEYVELNKKLSNDDKVELDYRVHNGQSKIEALNAMGKVKHKK